jgi:hypothetical protein
VHRMLDEHTSSIEPNEREHRGRKSPVAGVEWPA